MDMFSSFVDEMQKIAASKERMSVPQARAGRRSMSVETMLRKEKEGSLFKKTAEELPERDKLVQEEASRQARRAMGNKALAGGGAVLGGAGLSTLSQVPGGLFGYKTLHHGTDAISAASIREHGLKPLNQLNLEPNEAASKTMGSLMGLDTTGLAYASSNVLDPAKFSLIRASTSGVKPSIVTGHIPYDRFKNEWIKDPEGRLEAMDFGDRKSVV